MLACASICKTVIHHTHQGHVSLMTYMMLVVNSAVWYMVERVASFYQMRH